MGSYLSQPVLEKSKDVGDDLDCPYTALAYACVDMQGWRKSMEDAHVIATRVPFQSKEDSAPYAKVFGVFDGHGGPEVARFCQRHLVNVLSKEEKWLHGDVHGALTEAFHSLDLLIDDPERLDELTLLRNNIGCSSEKFSAALNSKESPLNLEAVEEGDPSDEVSSLDTTESCEGISDDSDEDQDDDAKQLSALAQFVEGNSSRRRSVTMGEAMKIFQKLLSINGRMCASKEQQQPQQQQQCQTKDESPSTTTNELFDKASMEYEMHQKRSNSITLEVSALSNLKLDADIMAIASNNSSDQKETATAELEFHECITHEEENKIGDDGTVSILETAVQTTDIITAIIDTKDDGTGTPVNAPFQASCVVNGRQVCTLSRHPVQAGCTSIVAVLVGRKLFVANAGDSRAVLCRANGIALPLSEDHKPLSKKEMERITNAGGFVNRFGRVNGNLNLSRSIGDLKYKQIPGLRRCEQMITAEPDIMEIVLNEDDEFLIIGCDGIWDCLTNEEAVDYVLKRIHQKAPQDILTEMFDKIISKDPGASMGLGGDNMTCIVVDLLPHSRSFRQQQMSLK